MIYIGIHFTTHILWKNQNQVVPNFALANQSKVVNQSITTYFDVSFEWWTKCSTVAKLCTCRYAIWNPWFKYEIHSKSLCIHFSKYQLWYRHQQAILARQTFDRTPCLLHPTPWPPSCASIPWSDVCSASTFAAHLVCLWSSFCWTTSASVICVPVSWLLDSQLAAPGYLCAIGLDSSPTIPHLRSVLLVSSPMTGGCSSWPSSKALCGRYLCAMFSLVLDPNEGTGHMVDPGSASGLQQRLLQTCVCLHDSHRNGHLYCALMASCAHHHLTGWTSFDWLNLWDSFKSIDNNSNFTSNKSRNTYRTKWICALQQLLRWVCWCHVLNYDVGTKTSKSFQVRIFGGKHGRLCFGVLSFYCHSITLFIHVICLFVLFRVRNSTHEMFPKMNQRPSRLSIEGPPTQLHGFGNFPK